MNAGADAGLRLHLVEDPPHRAAVPSEYYAVPVRPLRASQVRRLLRDGRVHGSVYRRPAYQGPFPREHRWVAITPPVGCEPAGGVAAEERTA